MVSPVTHRGFDQQGTCIVQRTGVDANTQINPAEVKAAIENVKNVFEEQMQIISQSLTHMSEDAEEAVIVQGTNMSGTIEDTALILSQLGAQVTQGIDTLYDYAVQAHDTLQESNNARAYNECRVSGVVSIQ